MCVYINMYILFFSFLPSSFSSFPDVYLGSFREPMPVVNALGRGSFQPHWRLIPGPFQTPFQAHCGPITAPFQPILGPIFLGILGLISGSQRIFE